jgi:hypothetical protein
MSTGTIFFSYSRNDSETILNIAKELRQAGATIWLDQLDIKPGSRWDDEIEGALQSSGTLIVAMTKSSVASQNVMDEVSYALEEGKKVVPILLEECEIPFRLRRLQYSDFCLDYKNGMKSLSEVLGLDKEVAAKLTHNISDTSAIKMAQKAKDSPAPSAKAQPKAAASTMETSDTTKKRNRMPIYAVGGVIAILIILWGSGVFSDSENSQDVNPIDENSANSSMDENFEYDGSLLQKGIANFTISSDADLFDLVEYIGKNGQNNSAFYQAACKDIYPLFNKEAIVVYFDSSGRSFDKKLFHSDGKLVYEQDDDIIPKIGDLMVSVREVDLFDVGTQQYMEGMKLTTGKIIYVTQISETEGEVYLYIRYADFN